MTTAKIEIELDGIPSTKSVLSCEEARITCTHRNFHQLTVETGGQSEIVVNHSGVEISIGRATDSVDQIRVTVIDSHGRARSLEFDASAR